VYVRFWGTRGSIASPGEGTVRYGGNTSCVELRAGDGTVIVLDCGTGARDLGLHLVRTMPSPLRLHLFIGHTHWDHIQGFPFFVPAFLPGAELNVYAPLGFQQSLEEAMSGQMEYSYFPVKLRDLRSRIHFSELEEGFFRVGDVLVETQYLNHTAPTIAYRMTNGGATVAYVTDHEPFWKSEDGILHHPGDQRHVAFLRGADLVIHDAQYTDEQYINRVGWGHSTIEYATDVAQAAGVKRLALFHHDPTHDDDVMDRMEAAARARVAESGSGLDVFAAREGLEVHITGSARTAPVAEISALRRRLIAGARVLVVTSDESQVATIEEVLAEDGMVALPVPDMHAALRAAPSICPTWPSWTPACRPATAPISFPRSAAGWAAPTSRHSGRSAGGDAAAGKRPTISPSPTARRCSARACARGWPARAWRTSMFRDRPPTNRSSPSRMPARTAAPTRPCWPACWPGCRSSVTSRRPSSTSWSRRPPSRSIRPATW
jgi:phosphoribosyl 1,2-cyclic phosphodiesterase